MPYDLTCEAGSPMDEAKKAYRNTVIEECAQVVRSLIPTCWDDFAGATAKRALEKAVEEISDLKSQKIN